MYVFDRSFTHVESCISCFCDYTIADIRTPSNERQSLAMCTGGVPSGIKPATVRQCGATFVPGIHDHCHTASACAAETAKISKKAKLKAMDNPYMSAFSIAEGVLKGACAKQSYALCIVALFRPTGR